MMSYDPRSKEWLLNRYEIYKELRARDTAYWSEKYQVHVITRYDDVFFVLNNPKIFSSSGGNLLIEHGTRLNRTLGASDNPLHNDYKDIVLNAYHKDNIQRIADVFSDNMIKLLSDKTELNVSNITEEIAAWASTEIINSPLDKHEATNLSLLTYKHHPLVSVENAIEDFDGKYAKLFSRVKLKMASKGPGVYHEYVTNNPKNLDVIALILGPMMTGVGSLAAALQYLTLDLFYEDQLDALLKDRSLIPQAVNESLRFNAAVGRFTRTVTENVTLHGIDLKPGDRIAIALESANRDETKFVDADKFIINRTDKARHLAWGHGVHVCIALAISKAMLRLYLEILLDKVGKYEILTKPSELEYILMYGGNISIMSNIMMKKL
jgi:cytochrome P450